MSSTPQTYYVHTDHLSRPIKLSNASRAMVWEAEWTPWGALQSITGSLTLNTRFPGQWFQLEAGLLLVSTCAPLSLKCDRSAYFGTASCCSPSRRRPPLCSRGMDWG